MPNFATVPDNETCEFDDDLNKLRVKKVEFQKTAETDTGKRLAPNGAGGVAWVATGDFVDATMTFQQDSNVAGGDHLKFDSVLRSQGTSAVLDTSTPYTTADGADSVGRLTLAPGTYLVECIVPQVVFNGSGGFLQFAIYDADLGTRLTQDGVSYPMTSPNSIGSSAACSAVLQIAAQKRIEVRISTSSGITQIGVPGTAPSLPNIRVARLG